ncbi:unnamed protein product [Rhizophagus irregularis]|nr:unnamed protein product [Rhizophagus irregularis]
MQNSAKLSPKFFDEIKACVKCGGGFGLIRCYGISQEPETGDYIIVLYYAHRGNLRTYLEQNYGELDWIQKLGILKQIAEGLNKIHQAGLVHRDFHSGNILQDGVENEITAAFNTADYDCSQLSSPASSRPVTVTHPLAIYTSRLLDFTDLPEPINAPFKRLSVSTTRSIDTITGEEEYVTRQFEEDLVYVPETETISAVTFVPEEKDVYITRQFDTDLPWEGS